MSLPRKFLITVNVTVLLKTMLLQVSLQAGLRTLHEAGPELRRAISGSLEEATDGELEPATRRNLPFFGSVIQSIRRKGSMKSLTVNNVQASATQEKTSRGTGRSPVTHGIPIVNFCVKTVRSKSNFQHARVSPTNSYSQPAQQNSFSRNMSDK